MSNYDETPKRPEAPAPSEFGQSTRRTFLSRIGMASLLATTGPALTTLAQRSTKVEPGLSAESKDAIPVTLRVNGKKHDFRIEKGMRSWTMRCVHCAHQWPAREFLSVLRRHA